MVSYTSGYFFERRNASIEGKVSVISTQHGVRNFYSEIKTIRHHYWVLDYSISDCGLTRVNKKSAPWLQRGSGIAHLYAPETSYWEDWSKSALPAESSHVSFYGGEVLGLQKHINNCNGFGRFFDKNGKLDNLLRNMAEDSFHYGEKSYWLILSRFYEIVHLLNSAQQVQNGAEYVIGDFSENEFKNRDLLFIESIQKFLQQNMHKTICLTDVAAYMKASNSTISHKYQELTGESPMKTLMTIRINAVKNYLAKGDSIKAIASQTGFCNEFHLSKAFKKLTGISPSKFLKKNIF